MSDPPRTRLIESLRRQLLRPDLEDAERLALAEALSRRLADAVEDGERDAADEAIALLATLTADDGTPASALASAARGLSSAHYRLRVEQERDDRQTARILRGLRELAGRPHAPPAARLALADALEQEVSAQCWADDWTAAQAGLAELRENARASGRVQAVEPLARALTAAVCCACTLRASWGGRREWLDELRRLSAAWPRSGPIRVALAEALGRELVVAIEVGQHILAHTLLMEIRDAMAAIGAAPLGQLPEALCAAVLKAVRAGRRALAAECLDRVRALTTLPNAVQVHGDQLAEAMFCCFVWATGEDGPADAEALLADLRAIAGRTGGTRVQRFYLAKAIYNRHHEAGDARDWARCDALLDELRWLARGTDDDDLREVFVQALGNAHYDAWHCGQVTRAERAFQELGRVVEQGHATPGQRLEVAKALHRRHADAIDAGDTQRASEHLDALLALRAAEGVDDHVRFEIGDALAVHYAYALQGADVGRARACRGALEGLCREADDDADLQGLIDELIS